MWDGDVERSRFGNEESRASAGACRDGAGRRVRVGARLDEGADRAFALKNVLQWTSEENASSRAQYQRAAS